MSDDPTIDVEGLGRVPAHRDRCPCGVRRGGRPPKNPNARVRAQNLDLFGWRCRRCEVAAMRRRLDAVDAAVAAAKAHEPATRWACDTCTDPACCSEAVVIGPGEARVLADALARSPRRDELGARVIAWVAWATDIGLADVCARLLQTGFVEMVERLYQSHRTACPLLDSDGRCALYEARPIACRGLWRRGEPAACRAYLRGGPAPPALDVHAIVSEERRAGVPLPALALLLPQELLGVALAKALPKQRRRQRRRAK